MTPWTGKIAVEGRVSADNRLLVRGSLTWENLPLPLMQATNEGSHFGSRVVGRIDEIWRDNDVIRAKGMVENVDLSVETGIGIDIDNVKGHRDHQTLVTSEGRIRAAHIYDDTKHALWGCHIKAEV